jgi:predicted PurR-regulated permease PerM
MNLNTDLKLPFYAKASLIFIGLFAFITVLYLAQSIIVPLIYSGIIAIVLSPFVNFLQRKGWNRALAIGLILSLTIGLSFFLLMVLSKELMQFSDSIPALVERSGQMMDQAVAWLADNSSLSTRKINAWILERKADMLSAASSGMGETILNLGSVLVILVLIPVYTFMILFYQPLLMEFIHRVFRSGDQKGVRHVMSASKKIIQSYLVGLLIEAAIVAVLNVGTLLLLGIEYAILLGVIGAILNIIPYIGGIVGVALPMIVALATKSSSSYCLMVLVSYMAIQVIDNNYIIPKVVASKVKINALVSIVVVLAGGAIWGIPGMFLSIPLAAVIKVIFDNVAPLKPWGYLLGDTMPPFLGIKSPVKPEAILRFIKRIR